MSRSKSRRTPAVSSHPAFTPDCRRCRHFLRPCEDHLLQFTERQLRTEKRAHTATRRQLAAAEAELARLKGEARHG